MFHKLMQQISPMGGPIWFIAKSSADTFLVSQMINCHQMWSIHQLIRINQKGVVSVMILAQAQAEVSVRYLTKFEFRKQP